MKRSRSIARLVDQDDDDDDAWHEWCMNPILADRAGAPLNEEQLLRHAIVALHYRDVRMRLRLLQKHERTRTSTVDRKIMLRGQRKKKRIWKWE